MGRLNYTWRDCLLGAGLTGLGIYLRSHESAPVDPNTAYALVTLGLLVLGVGLSLLAGYLLEKANKATLKDDKPTTLATRGSFLNWILGIRRLGPIFAWAGGRFTRKESTGKKGGIGSAPKTKVFYESGWHLIGVGPMFCMHRILQNGKAIFQGPITSISHPSGTFVDLGSEGGFFIYWGEERQPINTRLGDASRVTVSSRWPFHCYVEWVDKRLGAAAHWPLLDYEMEVRSSISETLLPSTDAFMPATISLSGATEPIFEVDLNGSNFDFFTVVGSHITTFPPKTLVRLRGNALADQDLEVVDTDEILVSISPPFVFETRTRIFFADGALTGADATGTLQAYLPVLNTAINPAHAIAEMLFARWPRGFGFPTSGVSQAWDIPSLDAAGVLWSEANEDIRSSWLAKGGETLQTVLGAGLQDLGCMVPIDFDSGLIKFVPVREPTGILARIRDDLLVESLPEIDVYHGERQVDKLTFTFPDRNLGDRDGTIAIMDDGHISYLETQHARNVQITITTVFTTASTIAQRRSQEELAGGAELDLDTNRGTRTLLPGDAITLDALPDIMRITDVQINAETGRVVLSLITDFYGVAKSPFVDTAPPETGRFLTVLADLANALVEVSEYKLGADPQTMLFPRIRAHEQISSADLHISRDNITYVLQGSELDLQTGGTLDAELSADDFFLQEDGPNFTTLGPDIAQVLDLSSDLVNWRLGRQLAVIVSTAGTEICFLRNITSVGGDVFSLNGLVRARFDTERLTHPAGSIVFIFEESEIFGMQDPLLVPELDLFGKAQPFAGGTLPLSTINPAGLLMYGKGPRPVSIASLRTTVPLQVNAYTSGSSPKFDWDYGTPQTQEAGAGLQGAGTPISSTPATDGQFRLEILDAPGTTVVRVEALLVPTFTYSNGDLIADLGGETDFNVRITQVRGAFEAPGVTIFVEKV